jgi:VanZ family protein
VKKFVWRWLPVIVWMGAIYAGSSIGRLPQVGGEATDEIAHRIAHLAEYAILGALIMRAVGNGRPTTRRDVIAALGVVALYGVSDEVHQRFVVGRSSELWAVLFDVFGGLIGVMVWRWRRRGAADRQRVNG